MYSTFLLFIFCKIASNQPALMYKKGTSLDNKDIFVEIY